MDEQKEQNQLEQGARIRMKKTHPCGNRDFTIIRFGADCKIKCDKCGHVILIDVDQLKKQCVKIYDKEN